MKGKAPAGPGIFPWPRGPRVRLQWPASPASQWTKPLGSRPCRSDRAARDRKRGNRRDLPRRLRHRRDRDELRDAGLALSQSLFRQRHLYLGGADLDRADRADDRLLPRRLRWPTAPPRSRCWRRPCWSGSAYLLVLPSFAEPVLEFVLADDRRRPRPAASLAALAIMFFPVTLLGMYSPFAIRLLLRSALTLRPRVGHGLRRLDRGLDRRHARHHVLPDPGDRLARDHAGAWRGRRAGRAAPVRAGDERSAAARAARARGAGAGACGAGEPRRTGDRRSGPRRHAGARGRADRPYRDRVQRHLRHQARRDSSPCRSSSRAGTTPNPWSTSPTPTRCRSATPR